MRGRFINQAALAALLICQFSICLANESSNLNDTTKYLDAVRTFADNVLKYGRDTYGPKHTPLFVDGLNIHTHEPVKWIDPDGTKWILSNLASQQNLFRVLDGLTKITSDPKYKQAAVDAIKYAFDSLRNSNGLLYWGHGIAYDVHGDKICGRNLHSLKYSYPYYELMWEVNSSATKQFIEAFWSAHILDWSNLDMNRYGEMDRPLENSWQQKYKGGPVFFKSEGSSFFNTGSDLFYAAAILSELSGEKEPLIWSKRLASRYVETRNPKTGISGYIYSQRKPDGAQIQLSDDFKEHFIFGGVLFPAYPELRKRTLEIAQQVRGWICELLLGDLLGADGEEFQRWALEELTAWGKAAYRKEDNSFVPMLTDSTSLEGYVFKKSGYYGPKGMVIKAWPLGPIEFWAYCLAYRISGYKYIWEMARNIGQGSGFGDIGATPSHKSHLQADIACTDPYALLGFLELYKATAENRFLEIAQSIGNNILSTKFYKGFFVPTKKHIYAKFDVLEHLALLYLHVAMKPEAVKVPCIWPSQSTFRCSYRDRIVDYDIYLIYTLTGSSEVPVSLHEAAALGDIIQVTSLISQSTNIDFWDLFNKAPLHYAAMNGHEQVVELLLANGSDISVDSSDRATALHYAAEGGHINVVELLIRKGADVDVRDKIGLTPLHRAASGGHREVLQALITSKADVNMKDIVGNTPLHSAARRGYTDIVRLLITKGVDVNTENNDGQTPIDMAISRNRKEIAELLIANGADVSIQIAAHFGALAKVESLIKKGTVIDERDILGKTALHYAVEYDHKDVAELLIANGADVNAKDKDGNTPGHVALGEKERPLLELLIAKGANLASIHLSAYQGDLDEVKNFIEKGADIEAMDSYGATPLYYAAARGSKELVEFLIARGANVNAKDKRDLAPLHVAAVHGHKDVVAFLIDNAADIYAKGQYGYTPIYWAAWSEVPEVVELLLEKGVDVNTKDEWGNTPLHYMAEYDYYRNMAEFLIVKDADVNAKNNQGKTPLQVAKEKGHTEIVELLKKHGAKE